MHKNAIFEVPSLFYTQFYLILSNMFRAIKKYFL